MSIVVTCVVLSVVAYLIGSLPFAVILSSIFRLPHPRSYGSGNTGATNVFRKNKKVGLLTLVADVLKAYLVVSCLPHLVPGHFVLGGLDYAVPLCLFFVIAGHIFSIFMKFKGGKGVACAIGALFAVDPVVAVIGVVTMFVLIVLVRYSFFATLLGLAFTFYLLIFRSTPEPLLVSYFLSMVIIYAKHYGNVLRFVRGEENRLHF